MPATLLGTHLHGTIDPHNIPITPPFTAAKNRLQDLPPPSTFWKRWDSNPSIPAARAGTCEASTEEGGTQRNC